jgi:hypothetical protein
MRFSFIEGGADVVSEPAQSGDCRRGKFSFE